jgi:hypothetical protein
MDPAEYTRSILMVLKYKRGKIFFGMTRPQIRVTLGSRLGLGLGFVVESDKKIYLWARGYQNVVLRVK